MTEGGAAARDLTGCREIEPAVLRDHIAAQACAWCGRQGLKSLANHTVLVHGIRAAELRKMAQLAPTAPLCAPELSGRHRELAIEQDTTRWLHRPDVRLSAAATREEQYDDEQRARRAEHLASVRTDAAEAARRRRQQDQQDPELAAARLLARSAAHRMLRPGSECGICATWFCSATTPGEDYRQRQYCSAECLSESFRRLRRRAWRLRCLEKLGFNAEAPTHPQKR